MPTSGKTLFLSMLSCLQLQPCARVHTRTRAHTPTHGHTHANTKGRVRKPEAQSHPRWVQKMLQERRQVNTNSNKLLLRYSKHSDNDLRSLRCGLLPTKVFEQATPSRSAPARHRVPTTLSWETIVA